MKKTDHFHFLYDVAVARWLQQSQGILSHN